MLHSSRWSSIYFSELCISDLTVIIPSMFCTGAVETVRSCIGLSLLLASLYSQVVSFLAKRHLFLQLHTSNFRLCVKFVKNTSKFLEVIDPFVSKIWSFMTFHGGFSIFNFDFWFMKPQLHFFGNVFSYRHQHCCQISCLLVGY